MEPRVTRPTLACLAVLLLWASGCDRNADAPKATPPAAVANPVTEANLSTITLTPEAEKRLGIATATATVETIARTRTIGGEVVIPPGRSVTVSAPIAGTVRAQATAAPRGGTRVERGQTIFTLFPLQAGERDMRIEADKDLAAATAELQATDHRLTRLEGLLKDGATSVRAVEEARAQQQVASAAVNAARARVESLRGGAVGTRGEIAVRAPLSGVLQEVTAAPGQAVAAGAPLFTVAQVDALWVRVPLYVGDREVVDPSQPVTISSLRGGQGTIMATRVSGPLSADPATSTTDLFFAPSSGHDLLRAGERVNVQLPLRESESSLVVPDASIVYDMQGGTWVYEGMGNHVFARRRVEVRGQSGNKVLIARGLVAGQRIVTDGAAELFGTEFGAGK